jgi:hypothetical protein
MSKWRKYEIVLRKYGNTIDKRGKPKGKHCNLIRKFKQNESEWTKKRKNIKDGTDIYLI